MALFDELQEPISVYRPTIAVGFNDATIAFVSDELTAYIEPVTATNEYLNQQDYQGIDKIAFMPIEFKGVVKPNDYIVDEDGMIFQNIGIPENWKYILPYVMLKLKVPQELPVLPVV